MHLAASVFGSSCPSLLLNHNLLQDAQMSVSDDFIIELVGHKIEEWKGLAPLGAFREARLLVSFFEKDARLASMRSQFFLEKKEQEQKLARQRDAIIKAENKLWELKRPYLVPLKDKMVEEGSSDPVVFSHKITEELALNLSNPSDDMLGIKHIILTMNDWMAWLKEVPESYDEDVSPRTQQERIDVLYQHLEHEAQLCSAELPGAAAERLEEFARGLNPTPPSVGDVADFIRYKTQREQVERLEQSVIWGDLAHTTNEGLVTLREMESLKRDALLVLIEMRARLLLGWSRRALMQRFAARSARFSANFLRNLCQKHDDRTKQQKVEDRLTNFAARFIFNQGLNPLTNLDVGGVRPDIFDVFGTGPALYIESKQYGDRTPGLTDIHDWSAQVWNTWHILSQSYSDRIHEGFLLVFRWGTGRQLALPPVVQNGTLTLYPMLVDIAPSGARGSRAEPLVQISEHDLLPQPT